MNKLILSAVLCAVSAISAFGQRLPADFSDVLSPDVPAQVSFCSETVQLDRVDMYEAFDRELTSIVYTHGTTLLIIKRANRYFPELSRILRENNVPQDLLYLACVESSLSNRAVSPAKAAGIWQFMPTTAREYGLEVSDEVDERFNIEKATAAACRYLKSSYNKFGDWASAMAAYNGGHARISKELDRQGADTSLDLYLTEETTRYPYRIMAMKTVLENPGKYGFHLRDDQLYQPRVCDIVEVKTAVESWPEWARNHGISYSTLRDENPWIRAKKLTNRNGKTYKVRVPKQESLRRSTAGHNTFNPNWIDR